MIRAVKIALILSFLLVLPAFGDEPQRTELLGDIGVIKYYSYMKIDIPRLASLVELIFDLIATNPNGQPTVEMPKKLVINVVLMEEMEERYCRDKSASAWRECVRQLRSPTQYRFVKGRYDDVAVAKGELRIDLLYPVEDDIVIHEVSHYILWWLSPEPFLFNNHNIVYELTRWVTASPTYGDWRRSRPWR